MKNSIYGQNWGWEEIRLFRKFTTSLLAIIMLFSSIIIFNSKVYAIDNGWNYIENSWCYYQDGVQLQEGWAEDYQGWCYIKDGTLVKEGWVTDAKGETSYIKEGHLMKEGWAMDSVGWRYIRSGVAINEGWAKDSDGFRYLKDGYILQEGWAKDSHGWRYIKDGKLVTEGWAKDSKGWGYIQNGYLAKASMWAVDSKGWSHVDSNGYWDGQTTLAVTSNNSPVVPSEVVNGKLVISIIDVGQAEAILIKQGNSTMLIDAGYDTDGPLIKNYIESQGINHLDYVIGTHPHEDHIGGLGYIMDNFKTDHLYMPKATIDTKIFEDFMTIVKRKDMSVITPVPGTSFKLGDAVCTILGPVNPDPSDLNTYSMVIKVTFGNNSFLFTADAVKSNEEAMIKEGFNLSADILKVGHHGVFNATSQGFLEKVNPKYALISVGKGNLNGPPAPEVLTRLYNNKISTLRTDINGTIMCTSDGKDITFDKVPVNLSEYVKDSDIQIIDLDIKEDIITIKNKSKNDQDMTGWKIVNPEGKQVFNFPENFILEGEKTVKISSGNLAGDLIWDKGPDWKNQKAKLYDNNEELIFNK